MAEDWRRKDLGGLALLASGFIVVFASLGGLAIGMVIDHYWHTDPWGMVIGLLAGMVIGFWDLYRFAKRIINEQSAPPANKRH